MTRSQLIPPALGALCLTCLLIAAPHALAEPDSGESLKTNIPLAAAPDAGVESPSHAEPQSDAASVTESTPEPAASARLLPPRTSPSAASDGAAATPRHFSLHMPEGAWRTIGALGVVVGLIVLLRTVLTRFGGPLAKARAPSGVIDVLGRFPLSRTQTLLLIKVDRRIVLLGQGQQGLTTLSEITDPEQVASLVQRIADDRGESFSRQFERLITPVRHEKGSDEATATVIDLTRGDKVSAARRVASMLGDGGRA